MTPINSLNQILNKLSINLLNISILLKCYQLLSLMVFRKYSFVPCSLYIILWNMQPKCSKSKSFDFEKWVSLQKKEQSLLLIIETAKLSNLEGFKILFICGVSYEIQPILEHFFFEILSCYLGTSMETYAKSLPKHLPKSLNELGRPNSAHKRIILQPLLNWHKTNTLRLVTMGDGLCCYWVRCQNWWRCWNVFWNPPTLRLSMILWKIWDNG